MTGIMFIALFNNALSNAQAI